MPDHPAVPDLPEIRLAGFLHSGLGLGETGRRIARSLQGVGVPVLTYAWEKTDVATVPFEISAPPTAGPGPGISLLSLNGDQIPSFLRHAGPSFTEQKYVISVWFWELENLAPGMEEGFKYVDEVWTATQFIRDAVTKHSGGVPVHVFPHPVEPPAGDETAARSRFPFDHRFVFLLAFDYQSCVKRKNPGGVCEAFVRAFPEAIAGGPLCVIKSINANLHPVDHALLKRRWAARPDIVFMDDFLSTADRDLLCWRADACISLHRSEGLGLTLLEGMALGKPCIATAYSGNMSFMTEANSWLIPPTMVPVGRGSLHYEATQLWADPDLDAAVSAMREVAAGGPEVAARAAAGRAFVLQHHHPNAAGAAMRDLLLQAAGRPARRKPPLAGRRSAAEALKALKTLEDKVRLSRKSRWSLTSSAEASRQELLAVTAGHRHALAQTQGVLKHQEQQAKARHQFLLRRLEHLTDQLTEVIAVLPPST